MRRNSISRKSHPEFPATPSAGYAVPSISGSHEMLKRVQHDFLLCLVGSSILISLLFPNYICAAVFKQNQDTTINKLEGVLEESKKKPTEKHKEAAFEAASEDIPIESYGTKTDLVEGTIHKEAPEESLSHRDATRYEQKKWTSSITNPNNKSDYQNDCKDTNFPVKDPRKVVSPPIALPNPPLKIKNTSSTGDVPSTP